MLLGHCIYCWCVICLWFVYNLSFVCVCFVYDLCMISADVSLFSLAFCIHPDGPRPASCASPWIAGQVAPEDMALPSPGNWEQGQRLRCAVNISEIQMITKEYHGISRNIMTNIKEYQRISWKNQITSKNIKEYHEKYQRIIIMEYQRISKNINIMKNIK